MIWLACPWIMKCWKLPCQKPVKFLYHTKHLQSNRNVQNQSNFCTIVLYKTFMIFFSHECCIQTKTYQNFEYALSTKYYICCRFAQSYRYKCRKSNPKFHMVSSQICETPINVIMNLKCSDCNYFHLNMAWSWTLTFQKKFLFFFNLLASMIALQKWWKMLFISSQKLFLFSRYLIFVLTFWAWRKSCLIRRAKLISKFMTSQPG